MTKDKASIFWLQIYLYSELSQFVLMHITEIRMMETQFLLTFLLESIISPTSVSQPVLVSLIGHQAAAYENDRSTGTAVEVVADLVARSSVRRDV